MGPAIQMVQVAGQEHSMGPQVWLGRHMVI